MSQKVIFVHGYGSNCQTDKKIKLDEMGFDVVCETVDHTNVDQTKSKLFTLTRKYLKDEPIVVGHSLGGLWAYFLASKFELKCVLINPSFAPSDSISSNFEDEELDKLAKIKEYAFSKSPTECIVIGELGDEVLDHNETSKLMRDRAKVLLVKGGDHRFKHFDDLEKAVIELSESYIEV